MPDSLQDRLRLDPPRVAAVAQALRDIAALPDPVGEVVRGSTLANGLQIRQVRVPMGVIGMIYEARPNVTVDAAGLGLKSGNAVILRGGSAAADTNRASSPCCAPPWPPGTARATRCGLLEGGHGAVARPDDRARPGRPADPARRRRPDPDRRRRVDGAGHRDRRRQLPRLRRPGRRPRQGARDHDQLQDPPPQRLQRGRVAARPPRRRRGVPAEGARRARRGGRHAAHRRGCRRAGRHRGRRPRRRSPTRTSPPSSTASRCRSAWSTTSTRRSSTSAATARGTPRRSSPRTARAARASPPRSTRPRSWSTPAPASPTAASSASAPRSASRPQKLHARGPMALPELTTTKWVVEGDGQVRV